jgi:cytochrome P450/glutathione S-transferase
MIDFYYWYTPNGLKIAIMLEECGLPYRMIPVNLSRGEQFRPDFLAINPNNRIPAIVDPEAEGGSLSVFESGAILQYLADKAGMFWPKTIPQKYEVTQWLMWQIGGLGPMCGQAHFFALFAPEPIPFATERYIREANRLYGVMNQRLSDREYLAGEYSIADIACFPWINSHPMQQQNLDDFPHLKRWFTTLNARPGVQRGLQVGVELQQQNLPITDAVRKTLFYQTADPATKVLTEIDEIDDLFRSDALENPYPLYSLLRQRDPVHWNPYLQHWLLTRHQDVATCFEHPGISHQPEYFYIRPLSPEELAAKDQITAFFSQWVILTDPPEHTRLRSLLYKALTPMIETLRDRIQAITDSLLDAVQPAGQMDLMREFAYPLPVQVIAALLGIPTQEQAQFQHLCETLSSFLSIINPAPGELQNVANAVGEIKTLLGKLIVQRRQDPLEDLMTALVHTQEAGELLSDEEIIATCVQIFFAGHETTANVIGNGMVALLSYPEQKQKLMEHPDLLDNAVEELLRYDTSGQWFHLKANADIQLGDKTISQGQRILAGLGAANHDPEYYDKPDVFNIERSAIPGIYFGKGIHRCLGSNLARMEIGIAIYTILQRMPQIRLATDSLEWRQNFVFRGLKTLPVMF